MLAHRGGEVYPDRTVKPRQRRLPARLRPFEAQTSGNLPLRISRVLESLISASPGRCETADATATLATMSATITPTGTELRRRRLALDLSREQLSALAGVSLSVLGSLERGAAFKRSRALEAAWEALDRYEDVRLNEVESTPSTVGCKDVSPSR
jgi:hypothetical protein